MYVVCTTSVLVIDVVLIDQTFLVWKSDFFHKFCFSNYFVFQPSPTGQTIKTKTRGLRRITQLRKAERSNVTKIHCKTRHITTYTIHQTHTQLSKCYFKWCSNYCYKAFQSTYEPFHSIQYSVPMPTCNVT